MTVKREYFSCYSLVNLPEKEFVLGRKTIGDKWENYAKLLVVRAIHNLIDLGYIDYKVVQEKGRWSSKRKFDLSYTGKPFTGGAYLEKMVIANLRGRKSRTAKALVNKMVCRLVRVNSNNPAQMFVFTLIKEEGEAYQVTEKKRFFGFSRKVSVMVKNRDDMEKGTQLTLSALRKHIEQDRVALLEEVAERMEKEFLRRESD